MDNSPPVFGMARLCAEDGNGKAGYDDFFRFDCQAVLSAADSLPRPRMKLNEFKPDPNKAMLYALVPGLGQIYNRKYWKLPLVYGAFMGCMYAITWNNKNYSDYSNAYFNIMEDYAKVQAGKQEGHKPYTGRGARVGRFLFRMGRKARMWRIPSFRIT